MNIQSLNDFTKSSFIYGAALGISALSDPDRCALVKQHCGIITAENLMKPMYTQPAEDTYDFSHGDAYVHFAQENGLLLRGHTLLWHQQCPNWLFEDGGEVVSKENLLQRLSRSATEITKHYKGKIYAWDVVNEVIDDDGSFRKSKWYEIAGEDYIERAFIGAIAGDPTAKLIINDYNLESSAPKRKTTYELTEKLIRSGVRVDGIGIQMHIRVGSPTIGEIESAIEELAELRTWNPDFELHVTELDMSVHDWDIAAPDISDTALLKLQGERYRELFEMFARQAKKSNLKCVVTWGLDDASSWLNNFPVKGRDDAPLLFDRSLEKKRFIWDELDKIEM